MIELDAPDELPLILVDPDRMARVFSNLLDNALRHTPPGGRVRLAAAQENEDVVLRVCDDGPGIEPDVLPFVFDRFYKADEARQATQSGSGLGLAIARSIVETHGGHITVESEAGKGAVFVISFPQTLWSDHG